ncbi:MAG: hypothetical protein WDA60_02205 [Acidimicrobiia bacterium]|jgi:hypothetical protein
MDSAPVSRRAFLAGGAGIALAAATAGATAGSAAALLPAKNTAISPLVLSSDLHASADPQRFVFAIARGSRYASFGPAQVAFAAPGTNEGTILDTSLYKEGLPKGRGIYVVEATFPTAGFWKAQALLPDAQGKRVPFAVTVKPSAEAPLPGAPAPRAASPTAAVPLGVNPICTRTPACPLHDVSLSEVIGNGKPAAVMFATPALCTSQYCGPVLDELLDMMGPYRDRGVQMVHVEIWDSTKGATPSPTVTAWNLPSEPWLFTIGADGVIRERLDGAMATNEIQAALDRLVA